MRILSVNQVWLTTWLFGYAYVLESDHKTDLFCELTFRTRLTSMTAPNVTNAYRNGYCT